MRTFMNRSGIVVSLLAASLTLAGCKSGDEARRSTQAQGDARTGEPATDSSLEIDTQLSSETTQTSSGAHPSSSAERKAELERQAPDFTLQDHDGNSVSLSALRGKIVVLEWFNPECPFVQYAHTDGPARATMARCVAEGALWLAINSGAPGKQGTGVEKNRAYRDEYSMECPILFDESGDVGRAYGARTTPHMFVIDVNGVLRYSGALDDAPMGRIEAGDHDNYVVNAVEDLAAGRPVRQSRTQPYGCSVKYASP